MIAYQYNYCSHPLGIALIYNICISYHFLSITYFIGTSPINGIILFAAIIIWKFLLPILTAAIVICIINIWIIK